MSALIYLSKNVFAAQIGRPPSYITWLTANGPLMFSPNGKQVDVLAISKRAFATSQGYSRHPQERIQRDTYNELSPLAEPTSTAAPPPVNHKVDLE